MNIQFGSGSNQLEGFKNHDAEVDISKRLPYQNDLADLVFAEHLFEHVTTPEAFRFIQECRRILKPGGTLRLCVPVVSKLQGDHARDIILGHGHKAAYSPQLLVQIMELAGFKDVCETLRKPIDSHWKAIGKENDDLETCRLEGTK